MWKRLLINVGIDELEFLNKTIKVAKFIGAYNQIIITKFLIQLF